MVGTETVVASRSNYNREGARSLYAFARTLYRSDDGRLYFREAGGHAMSIDPNRRWVSRDQAIDWIATEARDPITGWGYTREQAERMVDLIDAGPGYRKEEEER